MDVGDEEQGRECQVWRYVLLHCLGLISIFQNYANLMIWKKSC